MPGNQPAEALRVGKALGLRFAEKQLREGAARLRGNPFEDDLRHALTSYADLFGDLAHSEEIASG